MVKEKNRKETKKDEIYFFLLVPLLLKVISEVEQSFETEVSMFDTVIPPQLLMSVIYLKHSVYIEKKKLFALCCD
jgi:hypothetical protein